MRYNQEQLSLDLKTSNVELPACVQLVQHGSVMLCTAAPSATACPPVLQALTQLGPSWLGGWHDLKSVRVQ